MGQAAVDLPDPSELPAAPVSSADDLLSQMAGDEIDRLLAEAEVEKGPPLPAPGESAAPGEIHPDDAVTAAQMDELFKELSGADSPETEAPPVATAEAATPVDAPPVNAVAVDAAAVDASPVEAPAVAESTTPVAENPSAATVADPTTAAPVETAIADPSAMARELDEALAKRATDAAPEVKAAEVVEATTAETETTAVEKGALTDAIDSIDASNEEPSAQEVAEVPIYLKPLVWLNAPMNALPVEMRDALGKIAILTLANAFAVLTYVMIFRRHRH